MIIPIGYIAVIAIIRDAQGGADSGLVVVYLLPIVWLSLYGRRLHSARRPVLYGPGAPGARSSSSGRPTTRPSSGARSSCHGDRDDPGGFDRLHHGLARPRLPQRPGPAVAHLRGATPARPTTPATVSRRCCGPPPAAPSWVSTRPARSPSSPPAPSRCSATGPPRSSESAPSPTSSTRPRSTSGARRIDAMRTRARSDRRRGGGRGALDRHPQGRPAAPLRGPVRACRCPRRTRVRRRAGRRRVRRDDGQAGGPTARAGELDVRRPPTAAMSSWPST